MKKLLTMMMLLPTLSFAGHIDLALISNELEKK